MRGLLFERVAGIWLLAALALPIAGDGAEFDTLDWLRSSSRGSEAVMPIPQSPNSYSWQLYRKDLAGWCERTMLQRFQKNLKGTSWDADATAFVRDAVTAWIATDEDVPVGLMERGRKLLDDNCDDPLVLALWAHLTYKANDNWREVTDAYERALKEFKQGAYPAAVPMVLMEQYAEVKKHAYSKPDVIDEARTRWVAASVQDDSYAPEEGHLFIQHVIRQGGPRYFDRTYEQLAPIFAASSFPPWVKHTLLGEVEVERAWKERGGDVASKVRPEGWEGFAEHLTKARKELEIAWHLRPDRPEAASRMIAVAMGGGAGDDSPALWFDRAVTAQFDYTPAYNAMLWALWPRWGGSHQAMLSFGKACAATKRYETVVPSFFVKALEDVIWDDPDARALYKDPEIARVLIELGQGTVAVAPQRQRFKQESLLAVYAWLTGDYSLAKRSMTKAGELHPAAAQRLSAHHIAQPWFFDVIAVMTSAAAKGFSEAEQFRETFENEAAISAYKRAAEKVGATTAAVAPRRRIAMLELEQALAPSKWVKVPTDKLDLWQPSAGHWSVTADGSLKLRGADKAASIFAPVRVGPNFEIRGEFQIIAPAGCCQTLGKMIWFREQMPVRWMTCMVYQTGKSRTTANVWHGFTDRAKKYNNVILPRTNRFLIQSWDGRISYYLNRNTIEENFKPDPRFRSTREGAIGFGHDTICRENTVLIRNLEVRRISSPPERPPVPPAAAEPLSRSESDRSTGAEVSEASPAAKWRLRILARISGADAIIVQQKKLWVEHTSAMKHGMPSALHINDRAWEPTWDDRVSSKFEFDPQLAEFTERHVKVAKVAGRAQMKVQLPSKSNEYTLRIDLADRPSGAGEVELDITW